MKAKSPKPTARNSPRQTNVSGRKLTPPSYGISFIDGQSRASDAPIQGMFESSAETSSTSSTGKAESADSSESLPNKTGLPDNLKSGIENLSGFSMDDVKVHYNSPHPAQLNALAYAQGTEIHIAPGEEKHLPHEAWHVVQQKQCRVKPTMQMKGKVNINDSGALESEADMMGAKALQMTFSSQIATNQSLLQRKEKSQVSGNEHPNKKKGNECGCTQLKSYGCYVPRWNAPYDSLKDWEQGKTAVGPYLDFKPSQVEKILEQNQKIHGIGKKITLDVSNSDDLITSDVNKGALVRKKAITNYIANIDHIVEKKKGGCSSVLNAQVMAESDNNGTTYRGAKVIYDADENEFYPNDKTHREIYKLK